MREMNGGASDGSWLILPDRCGGREGGLVEGSGGREGWRSGGVEEWRNGGKKGWREEGVEGWRSERTYNICSGKEGYTFRMLNSSCSSGCRDKCFLWEGFPFEVTKWKILRFY